jgi:hypothetical protein
MIASRAEPGRGAGRSASGEYAGGPGVDPTRGLSSPLAIPPGRVLPPRRGSHGRQAFLRSRRAPGGSRGFEIPGGRLPLRRPGRLRARRRAGPGSLDDASYPRQGFAVLGPIPRAEIDLETRNPEELLKKEWTGPDEKRLEFAPVDAATAGPLSTEVIPVRGRWDNHGLAPCIYLLRSRVHSPDARRAGLFRNVGTVPAVWLNGDPAGDTCSLRAGDNELLLAYEPPVNQRFSPEHAGPMFRIVDARSGRRLEGIRYQP